MTPRRFVGRYCACSPPAGYQVRAFESAEDFLGEHEADAPGCLLLDIGLPGLNGIELQRAWDG
jgi:FixJ family two-component response regulator